MRTLRERPIDWARKPEAGLAGEVCPAAVPRRSHETPPAAPRAGLATLVLASSLALTACHGPVLSARPEDEANTAMAALSRAGLGARKIDGGRGGFSVVVPRSDLDRAIMVLSASGLPRASEPGMAELFPDSGLVTSPGEERARYHLALSSELGASLRRLAGVREARVHLGLPQERSRRLDRSPVEGAKASVLLLIEPGESGSLSGMEDSIRGLIAGAVGGLEPEAVSVFMSEAAPMLMPVTSPRPVVKPAMLATGLGSLVAGLGLACFIVIRTRRSRKE